MSSAAELATLVTAARAVRGDFERAALTAGPGEDWLSWALRLAEHLGQVLDVIGQPLPVVLPANQSDCFRDMLADAETYRSKGVAGPCKDCDASPTALCWGPRGRPRPYRRVQGAGPRAWDRGSVMIAPANMTRCPRRRRNCSWSTTSGTQVITGTRSGLALSGARGQ